MSSSKKLYCVSNWQTYFLVHASSPHAALKETYKRDYKLLDNNTVTEDTVVSAMCCKYTGQTESELEKMKLDIYRVLWMDENEGTLRFILDSIR